jgi:hypothetical protein
MVEGDTQAAEDRHGVPDQPLAPAVVGRYRRGGASRRPQERMRCATARAPAPFWSATRTLAPSAAKASAVARRMPDASPVTMTLIPANLDIACLPVFA